MNEDQECKCLIKCQYKYCPGYNKSVEILRISHHIEIPNSDDFINLNRKVHCDNKCALLDYDERKEYYLNELK